MELHGSVLPVHVNLVTVQPCQAIGTSKFSTVGESRTAVEKLVGRCFVLAFTLFGDRHRYLY
eukprot:SAG11_NODE_88_length_17244_cov_17.187460_3_plen_62_part_00